jgi:DNA-binding transcriptional ArsR family regulator
MEYALHALRQLAHPEKAQVLVHLLDHEGESPEELSEHLERPLSSIYRYLADLEPAGLVSAKEVGSVRHYYPVPFRLLLSPETLRDMLRTPFHPIALYRASMGKRRWDRVVEAMERARKGEITLRQGAARSGLPYREFISLYQSLKPLVAAPKGPPGR